MSLPDIPGYRLVKLLDEGSRSEVYLAEQRSLQRLVALKLLRPGMAGDPLARQQLLGEGKSAARMSHPNLLAVFDIGETGGRPYIATEYLPKGTLRERLAAPFDNVAILRLARDLAQGLEYLHGQGFLHRDLKPSNIYFRDDGTAVLADAGITRQDRAQHPDDGYAWGSPYYMCPEQAQGDATDARSDLYSLGTILYEVLAGRPPFEGEDPMAIAMAHVQDTPSPLPAAVRGWQPLIDRLLAKAPAGRLPDADTLLRALDRIAQRLMPPAPAAPAETLVAPVVQPPAPVETLVAPVLKPAAEVAGGETLLAPPFPPASSPIPEDPVATMVFAPASPGAPTSLPPPAAFPPPSYGGSPTGAAFPPELPGDTYGQAPLAGTAVQAPMPPPVPADGATLVRRPLPGTLPDTGTRRSSPWPWIVLSLALVLGTLVLFAWWGSRTQTGASSPQTPATAGQVPIGETAEAQAARARRFEQREELINLDGEGNAVQAWRAVLAQDPDHREAQSALIRIRATVQSQIAAALSRGQLTTARALLEQAVQAFPDDAEFRLKLKELSASDR